MDPEPLRVLAAELSHVQVVHEGWRWLDNNNDPEFSSGSAQVLSDPFTCGWLQVLSSAGLRSFLGLELLSAQSLSSRGRQSLALGVAGSCGSDGEGLGRVRQQHPQHVVGFSTVSASNEAA